MTTIKKSSATSRKGRKVSESVNAANLQQVINAAAGAVSAPAGAGVTAGGAASAPVSVGGASVAPAKVRQNGNSQLAAALVRESDDFNIIALRQKISARWAAGCFELSEDYKAVSAAVASLPADIKERALNGARLAWLARPENAATSATLAEVVEHINTNFAAEFKRVCGCACPAASDVRLYSYTNLSVATIAADSVLTDYVHTSAVPAGLSASGLVSVVMSVRVLADVKKRFAAARVAARADLFNAAAGVARMALRLGVGADTIGRYMSLKMSAVAVADDSEVKRLRKNLASCWASLRAVENDIVLAAPAGAFGALEDLAGGWCFPASLPASASAKVRKLWAKRVRLLSDISTLNALLARC